MSAQVESQAESRDSISVPEESMSCRMYDDELGVDEVNAAARGSCQADAAWGSSLCRVMTEGAEEVAEGDGRGRWLGWSS